MDPGYCVRMARVKIVREGAEVGTVEFEDELLIGRDASNHVSLADPACSRHHAIIRREEGRFVLSDLASNNGTLVNGVRAQRHGLASGDRIQVGKALLIFEEGGSTVLLQADRVAAKPSAVRPASVEPPSNRLRDLYAILTRLGGSLDPQEVLRTLCEALLAPLGCDVVAAVPLGPGEPVIAGLASARISKSLVDNAAAGGQAALYTGSELTGSVSVIEEKIASILCVPIAVEGRAAWIVYADRRRDKAAFTEDDLEFAAAAGASAAIALRNASRFERAQAEGRRIRVESGRLIGRSPSFLQAVELARKAAAGDSTVLITGESGTGKELLARLIHERSPRAKGPFVAINCAALVETLLDSELFGHEKGAFTGATRRQPGKFEIAAGGTLFLDEIAEMSPALQAKLLRALQERVFFRVGGGEPVRADVRIVAATNRDPAKALREDLYYRLAVIQIRVPALRERRDDIPLLVQHFLARFGPAMKKRVTAVDKEALEALQAYAWPGNVRELENVIERAVVLADGDRVSPSLLPTFSAQKNAPVDLPLNLEEMERLTIQRALEAAGGKKGDAIKLLGISWPTLNKKLRDYGIDCKGL